MSAVDKKELFNEYTRALREDAAALFVGAGLSVGAGFVDWKTLLKEIAEDLQRPQPMNRLLQGDVGAGKTIVAVLAAVVAMENGLQVAFMAPTEILAEQHAQTIRRLLGL